VSDPKSHPQHSPRRDEVAGPNGARPDQVDLLFLGTGTSAGIPMIGCDCPVCTSADPKDKRTRASVVLSYNGARVLIDTTPELRLQCVANNVSRIDAVVFTHSHADHIFGLDDCRRFNAINNAPLDAWMDKPTHEVLDKVFGYAFRPPTEANVFRPQIVPRFIDGPFEIAGQTWQPIPLIHGKASILGFRVGKLAYCTDVSEMPEASYAFLHDLDVLVLDALQEKKHPTHFTIDEALEVVRRTNPKQTYFTHMSHQVMHAEVQRTLPENVFLGYDGLRVTARLA
jgi:phosphoribosyl 1,2-cyclic phosphate phosphodiesterase